jgi:glyoxylase I family protein
MNSLPRGSETQINSVTTRRSRPTKALASAASPVVPNGATSMRVLYVGLSVRDARHSARWYRELFGMETVGENFASSNWASEWDEVLLKHPVSGLLIGLLQHPANPGDPFSEFRTGLDHLEFEVADRDELERWEQRLTELGIAHSGIKDHLVTFRDPDNIQLEFFWPKPST